MATRNEVQQGIDASFQTQVLVSLAEIKGSIHLMNDRHERYDARFSEHQEDLAGLATRHDRDVGDLRTAIDRDVGDLRTAIGNLQSGHSKTLGAAIALAFIIPLVMGIIGWFVIRP